MILDVLRARQSDHAERLAPLPCSVPGCTNTTRERKPWCTDHVMESPHARRVRRSVEDRQAAENGGPITRDMLDDAWQVLCECGSMTVVRLARMLGVRPAVAMRVARRLEREGATLGRTRRNALTVGL